MMKMNEKMDKLAKMNIATANRDVTKSQLPQGQLATAVTASPIYRTPAAGDTAVVAGLNSPQPINPPLPLNPALPANPTSNVRLWSELVHDETAINNSGNLNRDQGEQYKTVTYKRRTIVGKKQVTMDSKIKAIARKSSVFIGRLDKDTSESDLIGYLADAGITGSVCKKLSDSSKDGREYKTSAFYVSCDEKFKDILFDDGIWPDNCVIREWWVKENRVN